MDRYYKYSSYLKEKYGVKTYKLTVNLPLTCPNRDGTLGEKGCYFCGEEAAGFGGAKNGRLLSIKEQLLNSKDYIAERYGAKKFIAYFQNYTNTYLPLKELCDNVKVAMEADDIVEISLATRPDCVNYNYLKNLRNIIGEEVNLHIELGLQTVNYHTLKNINRGHTLAEFIDAVITAKKLDIEIGAHIILNLPGDNRLDVIETSKVVSALNVDNIKLHALYIREGTKFGEKYKKGELEIISLEEYIERVIVFLEHLKPNIAVQRLLGKAPQQESIFVNWGKKYWDIYNRIIKKMEENDTWQGKEYNYLQGKALKIFNN